MFYTIKSKEDYKGAKWFPLTNHGEPGETSLDNLRDDGVHCEELIKGRVIVMRTMKEAKKALKYCENIYEMFSHKIVKI